MDQSHNVEAFDVVLARQEPKTGHPFTMKAFSNDLPKCCGDPWKGAYSLHGFWYKFQRGNDNDFRQLMKLSCEQDRYLIVEDALNVWKKCYGEDNVHFVVARNLRLEYIGGVVAIKKMSYLQIGFYFVQEDYRHSLIGQQLFRSVAKMSLNFNLPLVFQSMSTLLSKSQKFGLNHAVGRTFQHIELIKPSGYQSLNKSQNIQIVNGIHEISSEQLKSLVEYDQQISGELRDITSMYSSQFANLFVAFDQKKCVGYLVRNEIPSSLHPKHLIIAPLYSDSPDISEHLLVAAFHELYNPEEDYDFDPDCNAIYRRNIHFVMPSSSTNQLQLMPILEKLSGADGIITKHRLSYQTTMSGMLPGCELDRVHCIGDMFSTLL